MNLRNSAIMFFIAGILAATAFGQTSPNLEAGFRPYGSYDGALGTVNLGSGGMDHHLAMPMAYPQRGGMGAVQPFVLINSKNWAVQFFPVDTSGYFQWMPSGPRGSFTGMFTNSFSLEVDRVRMVDITVSGTTETADNYSLKLPDGGTHDLVFAGSSTTLLETVDASGYRVELQGADSYGVPTSAVVLDRQGSHYQLAAFAGPVTSTHTCDTSGTCETIWNFADQAFPTSIADSNGNVLHFSGSAAANGVIGDTLGKTLPWTASSPTSDYSDCVAPSAVTSAVVYSYPGPNGTTNQLKFCYANFQLATNFSASGIIQFQNPRGAPPPGPMPLLASIVLPDHTKWSFNYDSYGNVISLGLPLGGSITYTWTEVTFPTCGSFTPVSRAVASRTENDNQGHSSTWNYTWGTGQADGTRSNVVTDPQGNDTVHVFSGVCQPFEISTLEYQGSRNSGQLLKRVDTHYLTQSVATSGGGGAFNVLPDRIQTTIYPSGKVSVVTKSYDGGPGNSLPPLGNVTAEKVYDWGQGSAGELLRETDTTYLWQNDGRYLTARLLDLPASVVIKDGNANSMAETDYTYDESNYLATYSGTLPSGTHGGAPNPAPVRGNLTTVSKWLSTAGSVVAHTNWYDTGEVYQTIDPLGHTTTHSYDPVYAGAYSTKTCDTLSHCVSGTYDFTTGALTSFTNANAATQASGNTPGDAAHTTNYTYDFMSRMTSATLPADPSGNHPQTTFNYPDTTTVERLHKITASLTDDAFTYFDGLGRSIRSNHVTPGGNALVDTTYDGLGRAASVTNPYFSTSELTYGVTQSQFDALGRVTQTTKQDGGVSTVAYSDNCATTTDEAGKQRRACTDGAGRLVEVDEPGDSFPGSLSSGSLAINGSLQSKSGVGAIGATRGSATVTISGVNQFLPGGPPPRCDPGTICDTTPNPPLYDSGKVYIVVNGHEYDYFYGGGGNSPDSAASAAQGLVNAIQADAGRVVNASVPSNGSAITLTAVSAGTAGNFSFSTGSAYDWADFNQPSFTLSPGGNLSGGTDSYAGVTVYDAGTVTVTIGSFTASVSYGQSGNSTAQQVTSALGAALSVANSPVTASVSGTSIALTYKTIGTSGNAAVTVNSSTSQPGYFSSPSFSSAGTTLSGGFNPQGPSLDHAFYVTQYFYDALGNLLCVEQHGNVSGSGCNANSGSGGPWRVRRFTYDSLSRLLTANNPESGLIVYQYDDDGNLLSKTSPAANQPAGSTQTTAISYCYDALHRITGKAYSAQNCQGAAVVSYTYDEVPNGIGRLTRLTDQAGSAIYSYDLLGRMSSEQRTIAGVTKSMSYTYNLDGSVATATYPSGEVITYTPDSAGRTLSVIDTGNGIKYVTGAAYGPDNALTGSIYGLSSSFSGIANTFVYTNRLQPCRIMASSGGAVSTNCDASWGNVLDLRYDFHLGNGDNGNVYGITRYGHLTRNQTFTYDALNRLTSAQNAGTDCNVTLPDGHTEYWGNSYRYDPWGNLLQKIPTKCSPENLSLTASANNQLQGGYAYDAAGNMTYDATARLNYAYDQENRITGAAPFTYTYDADGNRVEKSNGSTTPPTGTLYWYMSLGIVGESDLAGNLKTEYIFFNGQRVARKDFPGKAVSYYFSDYLKTASVVTDAAGATLDESDYYPWGGELQYVNNLDNHYKFTGKERDAETGLDYFGARYYGNALGRFTSPDPLLNSGHPSDPQSWNRYTYTLNNPLRYTDPTGLYVWGACSAGEDQCKADQQRFRDSITKAKDSLKGLDPKSKEAKELNKTLNKLGEEGKGNIKINFGDAGSTDAGPNLGRTIGNSITINYDEVDQVAKGSNLNADEKSALDAGVTTHEGTHAGGGPSVLGFVGMRGEHAAYFVESVTYQGLHNTDKTFNLWNESWLTVDKDKLSIERNREDSIQKAIHPPKQEKQEK